MERRSEGDKELGKYLMDIPENSPRQIYKDKNIPFISGKQNMSVDGVA